ncbi:phage tail tube protein [Streptomyces sp. NPDC008265]|uniref:phage tail tube protein n=1 Tax=Streptomyces sp. NPDC008265 TaxID=3364824 RepID=UPI0036EA17BB
MADTRPIDARGWRFEVQDSTADPDVWLPIAGIDTWSYNPAENEETTETTAFDSDGQYEQDVMQRGASLSVEGKYRVHKTTKARDPGQAYIDDDWMERVGFESRNQIRYRHETQTSWRVWEATLSPGEQGGGNNDKTSWSASFTRCGAATTMAVTP